MSSFWESKPVATSACFACAPCIQVNIGDLLAKLSITILAPSVIGKLLREYVKPVEEFAKKWRSELSMVGYQGTSLFCG
jgi:predicted Na+-dependent transporter